MECLPELILSIHSISLSDVEMKFSGLYCVLLLTAIGLPVAAQPTPAPHPLEQPFETERARTEIILPQIDGKNFYKADFHTHTIFSDGDVTPDMRVVEAWYDGLDIIAITDHMEYRRIEDDLFEYMGGYIREDLRNKGTAVNTNIMRKAPDEHGILVDFNTAYELAVQKAACYGILVVRGVEITRKEKGDYNVIFTIDNNTIYDPDIEQALHNARKQGAFIVHNHPDYDENAPNYLSAFSNGLYEKGFIDGVEVANGRRTWWHLFSHSVSGGYTPLATSDAHEYIYWKYGLPGEYEIPRYRNMNLILADDLNENSIHEALKAGNTIAYSNNNLIGKRELLQALFESSIDFTVLNTIADKYHISVVNRSSLPYYLRIGAKSYIIGAMATLHMTHPMGEDSVMVTVQNMWYGNDEHPSISVDLK